MKKSIKKVKKKFVNKKKGCNFVAVIKQQTHRKGKRNKFNNKITKQYEKEYYRNQA